MDGAPVRSHFSNDPALYLFLLHIFPSEAFITHTEASFNRQRNVLKKFFFFFFPKGKVSFLPGLETIRYLHFKIVHLGL